MSQSLIDYGFQSDVYRIVHQVGGRLQDLQCWLSTDEIDCSVKFAHCSFGFIEVCMTSRLGVHRFAILWVIHSLTAKPREDQASFVEDTFLISSVGTMSVTMKQLECDDSQSLGLIMS